MTSEDREAIYNLPIKYPDFLCIICGCEFNLMKKDSMIFGNGSYCSRKCFDEIIKQYQPKVKNIRFMSKLLSLFK